MLFEGLLCARATVFINMVDTTIAFESSELTGAHWVAVEKKLQKVLVQVKVPKMQKQLKY